MSSASTTCSACSARADVDDEPVFVELGALELDVDHVSRAVEVLRGTEDLSFEAVRDHEVIAHA